MPFSCIFIVLLDLMCYSHHNVCAAVDARSPKVFCNLEVSESPWIWQELMGVGGCIFVYRQEVCIMAEIDGAV